MPSAQDSWKDNQVWAEWGRNLVREHPDGLGNEPNFSSDGNALIVWSRNGFARYQQQMWKLDEFEHCRINGKDFKSYPENSREDQIYIAQASFRLAKVYWNYAKVESDQKKDEQREIQREVEDQERQLKGLKSEVAEVDTLQALEIRERDLREQIKAVGGNDVYLHQQLDVVQNRLIEVERTIARGNWRWAVAGFAVGFLGLVVGAAFPVWDKMSQRAESSTSRECPTVVDNPAVQQKPPSVQPKK